MPGCARMWFQWQMRLYLIFWLRKSHRLHFRLAKTETTLLVKQKHVLTVTTCQLDLKEHISSWKLNQNTYIYSDMFELAFPCDHACSYGVIKAFKFCIITCSGLILGLRPANERLRYKVTPSEHKPRISPACLLGFCGWKCESIFGEILIDEVRGSSSESSGQWGVCVNGQSGVSVKIVFNFINPG